MNSHPTPTSQGPQEDSTCKAGTLVYTRGGLVALFSWLLWGDFMFQLMETVEPKILPILLKGHGATDFQTALIAGSLMMILNTFMNPIISYQSDRTRTRWGRRRPYIMLTTPFVVVFLAATPFAPEIADFLKSSSWLGPALDAIPISPVILAFGALVVLYQIFNLFVASVYYYLIPDVVPRGLLGRFYCLFRIVASLSGLAFNYFVFGYAGTCAKEIFAVIAVVYGIAIMAMCWKVKEGEYPPPEEEPRKGALSGVANFFFECYSKPYFWLLFLATACINAGGCANMFYFFLYEKIGYSMDQFGKLNAYGGILTIICLYPVGSLVDRWGAHKTMIAALFLSAAANAGAYLSVHDYASGFLWWMIRCVPMSMMLAASKVEVLTFPQERYGQFCSAQALVKSAVVVSMYGLLGYLTGSLKAYWILNLWYAISLTLAGVFVLLLYKRWALLRGQLAEVRQSPLACNDKIPNPGEAS